MMTVVVVSYIITWVSIIYSLVTAKSEGELWKEEIK